MGLILAGVAAALVDRARSAVGARTVYKLGEGGMGVWEPRRGGECDCTGFVSWVWQTRRGVKPGRDFEIQSDAMVRAAADGRLVKLSEPEVGCVLVYPGVWVGRVRLRCGHAAIVTEVRGPNDVGVVDCRPSNRRRTGDAIAEGDGSWMLRKRGCVAVCLRQHVTG